MPLIQAYNVTKSRREHCGTNSTGRLPIENSNVLLFKCILCLLAEKSMHLDLIVAYVKHYNTIMSAVQYRYVRYTFICIIGYVLIYGAMFLLYVVLPLFLFLCTFLCFSRELLPELNKWIDGYLVYVAAKRRYIESLSAIDSSRCNGHRVKYI